MDLPADHRTQRGGAIHIDERIGHSQTIVMKTLGAIQEAPANQSLGSIHSLKQVLDPTTSSRSKTLVTQRASLPRVGPTLNAQNSLPKGSSQLSTGAQRSLELRRQSIKSTLDGNQNQELTSSNTKTTKGGDTTGAKAKGNI